jgi:predicted dienelactone hydrolase
MRSLTSFHLAVGAAAILFSSILGCGSDSGTTGAGGTAGSGGSGGSGGAEANPDELFESGPYEVGYREFPITYSAAASGDDRELLLRVWYPAAPDSGADPARYALSNGTINIALAAGIALDAPPVNEAGDFPFAVYSHGNGGEGLLAYPYGELMASHGWIVVGPNHTGNTAFDFLDTPDPGTRSALDRPNDITAVIDEFEAGLSDDDLSGKADTSGVFVFGHSFGGYTTFTSGGADVDFDSANAGCEGSMSASCEVLDDPDVEAAYRAGFGDPRIVALAPQAPALVSIAEGELADLGIPTMLMTGRLDQTTPQETSAEPSWAGVDDPDDLWVEMPLGAHFSFITICYDLDPALLALFQPDAGEDGCGPQFIDAEEAVPVLSAYVLAFGRRHVLGETEWDAVLTGPPLGNDGDFITTLP